MISLIIASYNRGYTLKRVAGSFFSQDYVNEIIFILDGGSDDSEQILRDIAASFPEKRLVIHKNEARQGQCASRNIGVSLASFDYILFCDDDEYLESDYARICYDKFKAARNPGIVTGRRVYMRAGETTEEALMRFGNGQHNAPPYIPLFCEYINSARFQGDIIMPLSNAIMLTTKELLSRFPFDPYYSKGNGYREETDFQLNLFTHGYDIIVTNDCHSIHLPPEETRTGGQRINRWKRIYWNTHYTGYLFDKYYEEYARRTGMKVPKAVAKNAYTLYAVYKEILRPYAAKLYLQAHTVIKQKIWKAA